MIKKEIKYTDFNGDPQVEIAYFNLSKAELMEREMLSDGSFSDKLKSISESNKTSEIMKMFSEILEWAYGRRSDDGKRFIKEASFWEEFKQSPAYDEFLFGLITDGSEAAAFIEALMPSDLREEVDRMMVQNENMSEAEARSRASLQGHQQRDQVVPEEPQKFQGYPGTPHTPEQ